MDNSSTNTTCSADRKTGRELICLGGAFIGIGVLLMCCLPRLATVKTIRSRIDWLEEKQIDPTAMYYTELEMVDDLLLPRAHGDDRRQTADP